MYKKIIFFKIVCCAGMLCAAGGEREPLLERRTCYITGNNPGDYLETGLTPEDIGISTEGAGPAEIKSELSVLVQQKKEALLNKFPKLDKFAEFSDACQDLLEGGLKEGEACSLIGCIPTQVVLYRTDDETASDDAFRILMLCGAVSNVGIKKEKADMFLGKVVEALQKDVELKKPSHVWVAEDVEHLQTLLHTLREKDHTA